MAQLILLISLSVPSHSMPNPGTMCAACECWNSRLAASSSRSVSYSSSSFTSFPLSSTIGLSRITLKARFCSHSAKLLAPRPYRRQSTLVKAGLLVPGSNVNFQQSREWFQFVKSLTRAFFICSGVACLAWHARASAALASVAIPSGKVPTTAIAKGIWPKVVQVLSVFKEQGLLLSILLGLSAFFSMSETSITTLWPWKVRELAEKEEDGGVFQLLRQDVTRFLTTILIGTTIANIAATALVTDAATALFGEAGVGAATAVMTVVLLLLTEIAPKSIAVHNATQVARFVVRPVAWLSVILYPVGRVVTFISTAMLKLLGLKSSGEPFVTEEELRVMLRGAELSGAIEEEEQDMIENLLEIKDTHVREVMTPLVDVVAIDARSTLMEFRDFWVKHQYSRVPVFERRIDNIVGIAYAMDMLDYLEQRELLHKLTVGRIAHKPAYFVPDSMSVWKLLREFRIRKVHMAIVINEYGGAVGIVTLEDVVEEIVGEIFDENDSKEEIRRKTGYVVQRGEGIFDVDANTSIEDLSEALHVKFPEEHDYETVSGFVCESFGYIPRTGESIKVVLRTKDVEENGDHKEREGEQESHEEKREKFQTYKLEILAGNARKVGATRFEVLDSSKSTEEMPRPLPGFVRRAWDDQCEETGPEDGKVAILWDGKSIPCARSDSEPCDTADEYEESSNRKATSATVDAEIVVTASSVDDEDHHNNRKRWTEDEEEEEDDEVNTSSAMAFEKSMERRRQRRRKQALEASAELRRAEMKRREAEVSLRKPKEEKR